MKEKFTVEEAMQHCKDRGVNMLLSDINWLEEDAVFKLCKIEQKNMMFYLEDSVEDPDHNFITPGDLQVRNINHVWLDTKKVIRVANQPVEELYNA